MSAIFKKSIIHLLSLNLKLFKIQLVDKAKRNKTKGNCIKLLTFLFFFCFLLPDFVTMLDIYTFKTQLILCLSSVYNNPHC